MNGEGKLKMRRAVLQSMSKTEDTTRWSGLRWLIVGKGKTFCETDDEISSSVNTEVFGANRSVVAQPTTLYSGVT
jgi:hypothetical protein